MHRCQHGKAPRYLVDCCTPVTDVTGRQRLRSDTQQLMVVPRHRLSTVGRRTFAVQGPTVWNSLPHDLRAQQDYVSFKRGLKTWLFSSYWRVQRIRDFVTMRYTNLLLPLPSLFTLFPVEERRKAINVSVCSSVCLFARSSQNLHVLLSPNFLYMLPVAVAHFSSDGNTMCYVLPVMWMTSCFRITERKGQN